METTEQVETSERRHPSKALSAALCAKLKSPEDMRTARGSISSRTQPGRSVGCSGSPLEIGDMTWGLVLPLW